MLLDANEPQWVSWPLQEVGVSDLWSPNFCPYSYGSLSGRLNDSRLAMLRSSVTWASSPQLSPKHSAARFSAGDTALRF